MLKMRGLKVECICHRILVMVIIAVFLNDHGVVFKVNIKLELYMNVALKTMLNRRAYIS